MGRPTKTKVSETSVADTVIVINRVAKKLKSFSKDTLFGAVVKSFQKTEDAAELTSLEKAVDTMLTVYAVDGYTVANGVYTVIAGKRGRPKKVVEAVAAV
jgi:preprotein translocase subunit SecF